MKIKSDFVTNSSSSSFIIGLSHVNAQQLSQIINHKADCLYDNWLIEVTEDYVKGETSMDNFDMDEFLTRIGIDPLKVEWFS